MVRVMLNKIPDTKLLFQKLIFKLSHKDFGIGSPLSTMPTCRQLSWIDKNMYIYSIHNIACAAKV